MEKLEVCPCCGPYTDFVAADEGLERAESHLVRMCSFSQCPHQSPWPWSLRLLPPGRRMQCPLSPGSRTSAVAAAEAQ